MSRAREYGPVQLSLTRRVTDHLAQPVRARRQASRSARRWEWRFLTNLTRIRRRRRVASKRRLTSQARPWGPIQHATDVCSGCWRIILRQFDAAHVGKVVIVWRGRVGQRGRYA